ncbi:vWA domain-containing protein [Methylocaldum gracile subsp. desertum]|uniref:vWA domain-containing protein n=1 Tax=Methylocaldum sp. GT1BW TaxID=3438964 RepID=UPI003DA01772
MRLVRRDWRTTALFVATVLVALTFADPKLPLPLRVYRYAFVIDITQSMNVRDYHVANMPADRLNFVKESIRQAVHDLPCGSEVGLGLFTTQSVQLLFEPIEVCEHLRVIDDVLGHVDWRMAWAANSFVAQGVYAAIRDVKNRDPGIRLALFTDGQEAPPQPIRPTFSGKPGEIAGLIVGVGGLHPTTVPKYDRENRLIGYWENTDIAQMPESSTAYETTETVPRPPREGYYLSWLDENHLRELSATTGLRYHRLETPEGLMDALRAPEFVERRTTKTDIRWLLGIAALLLFATVYLTDGGEASKRT